MSDWQRLCTTATVRAYRTGWAGAWDAIKAAFTKDTRLQVEETVTMSIYVKHPTTEAFLFGGQMEHRK